MYKIDKGIETPTLETVYPFKKMEIGDSFFVPTDPGNSEKVRGRIAGACGRKGLRDKKFTIRIVEGGMRCWRIK